MATAAVETNGNTNGIVSDSHEISNSAKQKPEVYLLPRDRQESLRLNTQHNFLRDLNNGRLIHPCIPIDDFAVIADVACGTGAWLMDYASRLTPNKKVQLVGFDISTSQFPHIQSEDIEFVVHDMTKPFPTKYHNNFDLVNIRLVVAGLPAADFKQTILHVLDILKPGGYLQWLDANASDIWSLPFNPTAQAFIMRVLEEKAARGLSLCFSQDLLQTILSLTTTVPPDSASIDLPHTGGRVNLVTRSSYPYKLLTYDPLLIWKHPSADVRAAGHRTLSAAYRSMLKKAAVDRSCAADHAAMTQGEVTQLAESEETMVAAVEAEERAGAFRLQWSLTWIVLQKAVVVGKGDNWLNAGQESERV